MRRGWIWLVFIAFVLSGCRPPELDQEAFLVDEWLDALEECFGDQSGQARDQWLAGLDTTEDRPLTQEVMSITLARALGVEESEATFANASQYEQASTIQTILEMGYVELTDGSFAGEKVIDEKSALAILERANTDYTALTFPETVFEPSYVQEPIPSPVTFEGTEGTLPRPSSIQEEGLYQVEDRFYWVEMSDEAVTYRQAALEEVIQNLKLQTTFSPDLSAGLQLENDQAVPNTTAQALFQPQITPLKSRYFAFSIKGVDVSGHVSSSSLEVTLGGEINGFDIEDTFSISNLKITADASLNPFARQNLLLRVDYEIDNVISAGQSKSSQVSLQEMKAEDLETIRARIEQVTGLSFVQNELDIVTFEFPIPGTLQTMQVGLNLKLYVGISGEVGLAFSSTQSHGIKVVDGKAQRIQHHEHSLQPYLEGSAELTSGLSVDLRGFGYPLIDFVAETGVGARATTKVHYVNMRDQLVDSPTYEASLTQLEEVVADYQGSQEAFIDLCADVDLYWLVRLRIGSASTLVSRFGLSGSWTPIKKTLSLLHLENHRNVGSCTRDYTFLEDEQLPEGLHLSSQTLSLHPGQTSLLTLSDANGAVAASWRSDDPTIASVSSEGLVTAHQSGITVIKATSPSGLTLSCVVYIPEESEVEFSPLNAASFFIIYEI